MSRTWYSFQAPMNEKLITRITQNNILLSSHLHGQRRTHDTDHKPEP